MCDGNNETYKMIYKGGDALIASFIVSSIDKNIQSGGYALLDFSPCMLFQNLA